MNTTIEYRVRPVTRYLVTRYEGADDGNGTGHAGSSCIGEFNNQKSATLVAGALSVADEAAKAAGTLAVVRYEPSEPQPAMSPQ
jgi:hypothetical protein